jgi:membrane protein implicated in regulation of membrane protease activity
MENWLIVIWLALAVILFIAEIFTAGFFLICFGFGAVGAALAALAGLSPTWQLVIFIAVAVLALIFVRPFARRVERTTKNEVGIDRVIGQPAVVLEEIDPLRGKGIVRVAQEEWRAQSHDGANIPRNAEVRVIDVQGTRLIVEFVRHPDLQGAVDPPPVGDAGTAQQR